MIRSEGTHSCIITAILGKQVPFAIIEMQDNWQNGEPMAPE